jgi:glycosyltransferase involved in cell wall biosynthesis
MMRVLFVSDFSLEQNSGGAQLSNSLIIERGRELGYEVVEHNHTSSVVDFLSYYDLLISSNLEIINNKNPEKLDFIIKHPKHIRLEHDSCLYLEPNRRKDLFESTKKIFFLSNFHREFFKKMYGNYFCNTEINYDPINTNIFKKVDCEKDYDVVYCGYLHPLKGLNHLIDFAKSNLNRNVDVFGWGEMNIEALFNPYPNIKFNGQKKHSEIAEVFQKCNSLFHHPIVNEPFCRMIAEALLCGVEDIIGDTNKLGSYLEFQNVGYDEFKNGCKNAASIFWEKTLL